VSKRRRKSSSPNLPMETLERARLQAQQAREDAGLDDEEDSEEEDDAPATVVPAARASVENRQRRDERDQRRRSRRTSIASTSGRQAEPRQFSKRKSGADAGYVANMLLHPTKFVSEAELHQEYGYVIADLRSMFLLAAALLVVLVALAFIL
jgi:hypothetical protein